MAEANFQPTRIPGFATIAILAFVCLYLPIFTLVAYAFNAGTSIAVWEGFSLHWFGKAWANEAVKDATLRSLTMMVPEIVTAVALLIFFGMVKTWTGYQGLGYLILAHSAFCIPFAYLPIRARLEGMDLSLETAANDLYASDWQTFRHVTLPLLAPGILAGAMLAFVISLDDVVITEFVKSGGQDTLPTYMLGQMRRAITPEVNAISTGLLALTVLLLTAFFLLTRKKG